MSPRTLPFRHIAATTTPSTEPDAPTCPSCGGLQCLCRPRFFAGQLLTDEDLGLLNNYIVEKGKLHNRYLHGWGVVCGMEVVCNPCDKLLTVKSGYALSPCGEDIIVCQDTPVDICSLVQKCKRQIPEDCQPLALGADDPCASGTEDWILFVRYTEKMSRGIMPLKRASGSTCAASCGCGGEETSKADNGCGSGGAGRRKQMATTTMSSTSLAQCEPTAVCEGYSFDVCKAPLEPWKKDRGALIDRILCCFKEILPELSPPPADHTQWPEWCCAIRDNLLAFFAAHPINDCQIPTQLGQLCTEQDPRHPVLKILYEYCRNCMCSVLLPPCPEPVRDDRVPLATITIQKNPCQAIRVCNLGVRKFATTVPALQYWLSPLHRYALGFRKKLTNVCCRPAKIRPIRLGDQIHRRPFYSAEKVKNLFTAPSDPMEALSNLLVNSFTRRNEVVDTQTLAMASLGLTDEQGNAFMTDEELDQPFETIFLNQVVWPVVRTAMPSQVSAALGTLASSFSAGGTASTVIDELKKKIDDLTETIKTQQSAIEELKSKGTRKK